MPDGTITTKRISIGHDQNRYQSQIHAPSEASSAAASGAEPDSADSPATSASSTSAASASAGVESSA